MGPNGGSVATDSGILYLVYEGVKVLLFYRLRRPESVPVQSEHTVCTVVHNILQNETVSVPKENSAITYKVGRLKALHLYFMYGKYKRTLADNRALF
jgi:hypothetical protein